MAGRKRIVAWGMAVLAAAALALPLTRDWSGEAARLAGHVQRGLGLEIAFDGAPRLTLLPPALSVEQVRLSRDGADMGRIGRAALRLSPWSLLSGRVEPTTLALERVDVSGLRLDNLEARFGPDRVDGFTKLGGHAVTFAASRDRAGGDAASFRLSVPTLGTSLRFDGIMEDGPGGPALSGRASLNSGHLAAVVPHLALPPATTLRAEADLELGDGQLALVNLTVEGNGSRAAGAVLALAGSPALVEADLDIDRIDLDSWQGGQSPALSALLPPALTPPAAPAPATAAIAGPAPAIDVLANLRLAVGTLTWRGQSVHGVEVQAGLDQGTLVVRHAQARLGKDLRLNLDGTVADTVFAGRLRLNGPGLSGRADLRVDVGAAGQAGAGTAFALDNLHLNRDGTFVKGQLSGHWSDGLTAQWRGEAGAWKDTALAARLRPAPDGFQADDLSLRVGGLALRGRATATLAGARPRIDAHLRGDDIDLDHLPGPLVAAAPAPTPRLGGKAAPKRPAAARSAPKGGSPFSTAPLDWSGLGAVDSTLDLVANAIVGPFGRLDQPSLKLTLDNGAATLEDLRAGYLGGDLNATATATAGPVPRLRLEASVKGLDLARLKPGMAGLTIDSGRLNGRLRLESFGKTSREMAANARGDGLVDGADGAIQGIDLGAIDGQLARVENIGNVLALVRTGLAGGRTPFTRLYGRLTIKDGVVRGSDATLLASGGTARAELSVDLGRWSTDTTVSLALTSLAETPVVLRLSGPLDSPRKTVDANALQKALAASGLGRALGKAGADGGKALRDLFRPR